MKKYLERQISRFLLVFFSCFLVVACFGRVTSTAPSRTQLITPDCRFVRHEFGETCVSLQPQRIIVTDETTLDILLALGFQPIAAAEPNLVGKRGRHIAEKMGDLISVGKESLLNIERIVKLHPDLIIGFYITPEEYDLFSQIAPTIKLNDSKYPLKAFDDSWQFLLKDVGELLNRIEQAQAVLSRYHQRVQQLRKAIEEKLGTVEVSISRFYAGHLNPEIWTLFSLAGWVLHDVGLTVPDRQLQTITNLNAISRGISLERLDLLDADILLVILDPNSQENFKRFQKSPLWQTLNVVKNNRVYIVDSSYWTFGNILAVNAILDDLFKHLIEEN